MFAFPEMLIAPAKNAGINVPDDVNDYDMDKYPHWHVYSLVQLGAPMPWPGAAFDNASLIASLSEEKIKSVTYDDLIDKGLAIGHSYNYR